MNSGPRPSWQESDEPPEREATGQDQQQSPAAPVTGGFGAPRTLSVLGGPWHDSAHALDHRTLRSLLGAWALDACSPTETAAVDAHLRQCRGCADEAQRLRDAVHWLSPPDPLDLDPLLRARVLETCLGRRPARVPVPLWAGAYTAETARLDALLGSLVRDEWDTAVDLVWHAGSRQLPVRGVLAHLGCIDGLVASVLGLADPLGEGAPLDGEERTDLATERCGMHPPEFVRTKWRTQTQAIVRTAAFAGEGVASLAVEHGGQGPMTMRDALLDRAFECWIHADDIARAVEYPYDPPAPDHLGQMIDLAARRLPHAIAGRRRRGLVSFAGRLVEAGTPGRCLWLQVEGPGGGDWYIPVDSPSSPASSRDSIAHVALDGVEFCQLVAGHRDPDQVAAGVEGDKDVARDVLYAAASLSHM